MVRICDVKGLELSGETRAGLNEEEVQLGWLGPQGGEDGVFVGFEGS
jgi:hypothetical protein